MAMIKAQNNTQKWNSALKQVKDNINNHSPTWFAGARVLQFSNIIDNKLKILSLLACLLLAGGAGVIFFLPINFLPINNNNGFLFLFVVFNILALAGLFFILYFLLGKNIKRQGVQFMQATQLFDNALLRGNCGLWDWNLARGDIHWSDSMAKIIGYDGAKQFMNFRQFMQFTHPDDIDLREVVEGMLQSGLNNIDHRFRIKHASGVWIWIRLKAQLVQSANDEVHLTGVGIDISEQEQLEQKTIQADKRLSNAIETISEAFVLWDKEKKLIMCNSKYRQLYNLPPISEIRGKHQDELMALDGKPRIRNQNFIDENIIETHLADGRWLQISEHQTQDGGFVCIGTDITAIKKHEEKLMDSKLYLQSALEKQKKSINEIKTLAQKYNEEKIRAEEANEAKSSFLANISHELRTPLNAIIGFSDIMKNARLGPLGSDKYKEYAKDINDSGEFLLGVINDILDMSKIEAGRMELFYETLELSELIFATLPILKVEAQKSNINISCDIPNEMSIQADKRAIKQILLNLLSNAVKFSNEGGQITISARHHQQAITLAIEDNGIGISKEALAKLGQPFEQVQGQFTKNHSGSGLGLAIASSLVRLHNGTLHIHSQLEKGTLVTVKLPITQEQK